MPGTLGDMCGTCQVACGTCQVACPIFMIELDQGHIWNMPETCVSQVITLGYSLSKSLVLAYVDDGGVLCPWLCTHMETTGDLPSLNFLKVLVLPR